MKEPSEQQIDSAIEAYAKHRHPQRWDGPPWGLAGEENHRRAIKAALIAAMSTPTPSPWDNDASAAELEY